MVEFVEDDEEHQGENIYVPGGFRIRAIRNEHQFNISRLALTVFFSVAVAITLLGTYLAHREPARSGEEADYGLLDQDFGNKTSKIWNNRTSIFCFMVVQQGSMEVRLAQFQFKKKCGIFECNHYAVYSDAPEAISLGLNSDGTEEKTIPIPGPPALKGLQSCLGCHSQKTYIMNANVLMRAWDKAAKDGIAGQHSWIVKVDADSMLSAPRLVQQIKEHGKFDVPDLWPGRFFKNCGILDSMQGPVEVLSRQAFYNFVANKYKCYQSMDWTHMGEDVFVLHCLKQLGVWSVHIDTMLHDAYCSYSGLPNCWEPNVAVFHPLKDLPGQGDCWWKMGEVDKKGPGAAEIDAKEAAAKKADAKEAAAKAATAQKAKATTAPPRQSDGSDPKSAQHLFIQNVKQIEEAQAKS